MEKRLEYRKIIVELLNYYSKGLANSKDRQADEIYDQLIIDEKHDHYAIMSVGWEGTRRIYYPIFHLDIINEKIWVQEDATDFDIVGELEARNIPKSDIVLAFHSPKKRAFTTYAVA
jgi:tagatose-1,6-bisphosphate aldolase non-catalytic subunit AgaZ/GatZ